MENKNLLTSKTESNLTKTQGQGLLFKNDSPTKSPLKDKPPRECKNVKDRISFLHDYISQVNADISDAFSVVKQIRIDRNDAEKSLIKTAVDNKTIITTEISKLEEEIKKNFTEQKQENIRLQQIISVIKVDITETNAASLSVERGISQLEQYLGKEETPS